MFTTLRHGRAAIAGIALAALLAACGGTASTAPSSQGATTGTGAHATATTVPGTLSASTAAPGATAAPVAGGIADPCSLLTQAEVDAAVGQPLGQGKSAVAHLDCAWSSSDFAANVYLTVGDWGTTITQAASANGGAPAAIAGLGDEAWSATGNNGSLVYARKGSNGLLLIIDGPQIDSLSDHGVAQEKVLAAAILGRL